jgi:di/tricarboxylate transporter
MAIMVGNGANAGSLSPFAPTGIIVNGIMANAGMPGLEWRSYATNLVAHALVAFAGYLMFGGLRMWRVRRTTAPLGSLAAAAGEGRVSSPMAVALTDATEPFDRTNWITMATIAILLASAIAFGVHVGMGAFAAAAFLALIRVADHAEAIRKVPWNVIVMVGGVTVLISLLEKTQGLALFTDLLARIATAETVTAAIAFVTGAVSVYSSTSGVVLPAFLPTVPGLATQLGGADPVAIALSMNVGSHLVDVSPLSTIGALCIAAAPVEVDSRKLFNAMLAWGLSMTVAGAALCYIFFEA